MKPHEILVITDHYCLHRLTNNEKELAIKLIPSVCDGNLSSFQQKLSSVANLTKNYRSRLLSNDLAIKGAVWLKELFFVDFRPFS